MSVTTNPAQRSNGQCELCTSQTDLAVHALAHSEGQEADLFLCASCRQDLGNETIADVDHWRCLRDSMWSPVPAAQVVSYRMLKRLEKESWAADLLAMLYLDEALQSWADAGLASTDSEQGPVHKDSNGVPLAEGDTITLIKDLDVKGAGFTAKRGTAVRGIHLAENPEHIEGKVNGTTIVILTCYVKKA